MAKGKTVYILGAGASASEKLPVQSQLLNLIFSIKRHDFSESTNGSDFMGLKIKNSLQRLSEFYDKFDEYRLNLGKFIVYNFSSNDNANKFTILAGAYRSAEFTSEPESDEARARAYEVAKDINVTLEDLFTIFDNVIAGREHFRLYPPEEMIKLHRQLIMCIIYALSFSIATKRDFKHYEKFAELLLKARLSEPQKSDNLSIITMNWDDILEHEIYKKCIGYNSTLNERQQKIFPDLCFYNYDLGDSPQHIPSTQVKARGNKNIKVLKMHGSLAWLECPKCGRIFTDFSDEIASEEFSDYKCPICKKEITQDGPKDGVPILRNLIITPTFMKSFDNLNIKNIWHNAYIDISEADHIVFIGYSFPNADFEMRCLLKKAVKNTADITVVLTSSSDTEKIKKDLLNKKFSNEEADKLVSKMSLPANRYRSFFGEEKVRFIYKGFEGYLAELEDNINGKKGA